MRLPPFSHQKIDLAQTGLGPQGRRRFMRQLGASFALAAAAGLTGCRGYNAGTAPRRLGFLHGVASGDPLTDRVILWTRVTPDENHETRDIRVRWQVARDAEMRNIVAAGHTFARAQSDHTVKVDATGLMPGMAYFYRFDIGSARSPLGRTKTLPALSVEQVRFAVFSCANYPSGYFNVYADAARRDDLDVALHLGDYLYEYGPGEYGTSHAAELDRIPEPHSALVVLSDYRRRYAQYRTDPDLQALHARLPFITVWDDHEIADDAWRDGAANHRSVPDGPYSHRKAAAIQAYHEWMPIRTPDAAQPERIYRSFDFGKLVSLHMLDTRLVGRDRQIDMTNHFHGKDRFDEEKFLAEINSPERRLLGETQTAWLEKNVRKSKAVWQILGQQVLMGRMEYPLPVIVGELSCADYATLCRRARQNPLSLSAQQQAQLAASCLPCYMDSWDGYPSERENLFALMRRHDKNLVVLAGDTHNAWASDLHDRFGQPVGVEFATASVSSPGLETAHPNEPPLQVAAMMEEVIKPLYYAQTAQRGYMIITADAAEVRCDWRFVDTVLSRHFIAQTERSLRTLPGAANRRITEINQ